MIVLVSAFLLLSAFSCGGGNKANSTSEQNEKIVVNVPQFDADSAYLYVKNQVDFGPRVPNTKGQCSLWKLSGAAIEGVWRTGDRSVCRFDSL